MTKQDFIQQYQTSKRGEMRRMRRLGIVVAIVWPLSIAGCIWGMPRLMRLEENGYFDWAASIKISSGIGFLGLFLVGLALASRLVTRSAGVACPGCGEKIFGTCAGLAVMTGNCGHCGDKVVDDPGLTKDFKML
jgi:hypothetical protein